MRIVILDTVYIRFIEWLKQQYPDLSAMPSAAIHQTGIDEGFHTASVWARPFRQAGHEVWDIWADHGPYQVRWCLENNRTDLLVNNAEGIMIGGEMLQTGRNADWFIPIVEEQIRQYKPDLIWSANLYHFDGAFLDRISDSYTYAIGQNAAPLPGGPLHQFDLLVSATNHHVNHWKNQGHNAKLLPHACNDLMVGRIPDTGQDIDVSFIGNVSPLHARRETFLRKLGQTTSLDIFGEADWKEPLAADNQIHLHPALWGREMLAGLKRSKISLNRHIDATGNWATNIRLFEITGMGSALLTDPMDYLDDMFVPGKECIIAEEPEEAADKIAWYLDHDSERQAIALAGHERCMKDHTVSTRAKLALSMINELTDAGKPVKTHQKKPASTTGSETGFHLHKLGTEYGGWILPVDILEPGALCLCLGAGEDVSFDIALAKNHYCDVHIADPTPRSIDHVEALLAAAKSGTPFAINNGPQHYDIDRKTARRVHFHPVAIWEESGTLDLYVPADSSHVSHSALNLQNTGDSITVDCLNFADMVAQCLNGRHPDLIKMDVEGAEYAAIRSLLSTDIRPKILCIEFDEGHHPIDNDAPKRIQAVIDALLAENYRLIARDEFDFTFVRT